MSCYTYNIVNSLTSPCNNKKLYRAITRLDQSAGEGLLLVVLLLTSHYHCYYYTESYKS